MAKEPETFDKICDRARELNNKGPLKKGDIVEVFRNEKLVVARVDETPSSADGEFDLTQWVVYQGGNLVNPSVNHIVQAPPGRLGRAPRHAPCARARCFLPLI
jgi:hypothetical protein